MAYKYSMEETEEGHMKFQKPSGISTYFGWNGEALRVPADEYKSRMEKVLRCMEADGIDTLICVRPEDVYYLSGFYTIGDSEPIALIIPRTGTPFFVARLIEVDLLPKLSWVKFAWTCPDASSIFNTFCHVVPEVLPAKGNVGIQLDAITALHSKRLFKFFEQFTGLEIQDASKTVETARIQKSEYELSCIRKAAPLSEGAMQTALNLIKPGLLLSNLHSAYYSALIESGSEVPGYLPIVRSKDVSGHGSWMPNERVEAGNLVFLEAAACIHGHHSPLMRTAYILGPTESEPPMWLQEAEKLIQKLFETCLPMMVPGAKACDIDSAGRKIMTSNSFGLKMSARLAYSTGSTATQPTGHAGWGDADFSLVGHNQQGLKAGMVFHFIPWFQKYDAPSGPIGTSDAVLVTESGGKRFGTLPLNILVMNPDGTRWDQSKLLEMSSVNEEPLQKRAKIA
mmetsp:Transcript_33016/g.54331  ORF Transcript_33016/g.54331 Transcript_33016/m.54331 type:complete len:454 (+) Transcript_33016:37-1398(+)